MLPEAELWTEVIVQSIRDLDNRGSSRYAAREAEDWFSSDSQEIGSFDWACWLMNIEPEFHTRSVSQKATPPGCEMISKSLKGVVSCPRTLFSLLLPVSLQPF
jgi:hypothetical protein